MQNESKKLLNINQVCDCLGLSRWAIYQLIQNKQLKTVKIGKRRLVSTTAICDLITKLEDDDA